MPTSEIIRAALVLGQHATFRTVAAAVGMEVSALRERCADEGIQLPRSDWRICATSRRRRPWEGGAAQTG